MDKEMTLLEKIIEEINKSYVKNLWEEWKNLSLEEQEHIFSHLLETRNISVIKVVKQCDPDFKIPTNHPILIKAGQEHDKELLLSVLKSNKEHNLSDHDILMEWCLKTNQFDLVLSLDLQQVSTTPKYKLLYSLLEKGCDIDINHNINSPNLIEQKIIDKLNKNGINIFSNPKILFLSKVYQKLITQYIKNDDYIKQVLANDISGSLEVSETATIAEVRQYILNEMLLEAVRLNKNEVTCYLIQKGAQAHYKGSILLSNTLEKQNLELTKELVNAGANIHFYKETYLPRSIYFNDIETAQYLISFYQNNEEAIKEIENYNLSEDKEDIKQELLNHIAKIDLEKKLTQELKVSQSQKNKIKL